MNQVFRTEIDQIQYEDEIETRPVRRRDAVEAGLDYWMDENDLQRERQRKIAMKNRKVCEHLRSWVFHILIQLISFNLEFSHILVVS